MTTRSALILSAALAAALIAVATPASVRAQETAGRIQGRVSAEGTGRPLAGAQVVVRGTGIGSLTNEEGAYLFVGVPAGQHVVVAQLIGFGSREQTVTVQAGQTVTANFTLSETAVALDEIVVTGTAAQVRRKEIGNSIATIGRAQIENMPIVNASDALAGRAPGVTFMANSGQPGAGSTVKIRGINSVSQDAQPLIYVDGVRIANEPTRAGWGGRGFISPLQDIAPEDIARIEIVKGAAATTLYGTEASNGVIQIFTKRGVVGDNSIWSAAVTAGVNSGARWGSEQDPSEQYVNCGRTDLLYGFDINTGEREYFEDPTCPADGDWMRNGPITNYSLSVRGGTGNITYFASGNFGREDGILPTQRSSDGGFRANVAFAPTDQLTFTLNNSYQKRDSRFVADGNNAEGFLLNVGRGANNYLTGGKGDECAAVVAAGKTCVTNAYAFESDNLASSDHFTSGFTAAYAPTENFTNRITVGYDYTHINAETTLPFDYLTLPEGYYWDENTRHTKVSLDYTGSLQNRFGEAVASTFSWGGQLFRDRRRWTEFDVQSFAGPGEPTLESGAQLTYRADQLVSNTNAGVFVQEQIGVNDRLFVVAGLRVDGNSAFGDDFGLQPYPKVSLSYVLSDYDWWPEVAETFKLRAAIGESGKAPDAFDKVRTWRPVSGDDGEPGFSPLDIGNDEVGPERTRELEAGFDASFFDGRLGMEFTGFHARTIDALVPVVYPPSQGFLASRNENVGELVNKGLEFGLTAGLIRTGSFDWQVRLNGTLLESEVIDLDGGKPDTTRIYTGLNSYLIEGQPGPVYVQRRVMNPNEFAGPEVKDTIIGLVYPNKMLGLGTTFTFFDRLTLDALADFQGGHVVQNYTGYQSARRGAWHPCFAVQEKLWAFTEEGDASALADVTALERARCPYIGQSAVAGQTVRPSIGYWTEKGDFLKLRYVSLTYNIPQRFVSFADAASLTLSARNLFTITDYTGADPEMTDAADASGNQPGGGEFGRRDYYQIPPSRAFLMSVRFTF